MNHTERPSGARLFGLIVLAIFFPPISVAIEYGIQSKEVLWNLLLWIFIPFGGFIHAVIVLCQARYKRPKHAISEEQPYTSEAPTTNNAAPAHASAPAPTPAPAAQPQLTQNHTEQFNQAPLDPTTAAAPPTYVGAGQDDVKR